MSSVNIFATLRARIEKSKGLLPLEKRAMFWFRTYSQALFEWRRKLGKVDFAQLNKQDITKRIVAPGQVFLGSLYFFMYDPKLKDVLPYYDQFPFVLVLDRNPTSFLGLNFHYLSPYYRALLFDVLYTLRQEHADTLKTRIQATYDLLAATAKYKQFRPCLKRYLNIHIQSPLIQVGVEEWPIALFLPVESFMKSTSQNVWEKSEESFR